MRTHFVCGAATRTPAHFASARYRRVASDGYCGPDCSRVLPAHRGLPFETIIYLIEPASFLHCYDPPSMLPVDVRCSPRSPYPAISNDKRVSPIASTECKNIFTTIIHDLIYKAF